MADEKNTVSDLADLKDLAGEAPATSAPAEGAAEGETVEAPVVRTGPAAVLREKEVDAQGRSYATGRRKDAVARVWLKPGTGKVTVNGREQEVYFARPSLRLVINQPFLVACHHPLVEAGTKGKAWTHGGDKALAELAKRKVLATLSGHVHDAFDLVKETPEGPVRMIGAGTLSQRIRSTPQSFNELTWDGETIEVRVRNIDDVPTEAMQIDEVPEDAMPPREPGDPVAPVKTVPRIDPPVH